MGDGERVILNVPSRSPYPTATIKLLAALPKLEALELRLLQPKPKLIEIKREHRYILARGLEALSFSSLKSLCIYYEYPEPYNHHFLPGNLHEPRTSPVDSLNIALHKLSQIAPLTILKLTGGWVVSPELFWPIESESTPFWPTLEYLEIEPSIVTPDGKYYYTGDPDSIPIDPQDLNYGLTDPSSDEELSSNKEYIGVSITSSKRQERDKRLNGLVPQHI
ncbi:hypothetical protein MGYG_04631 [Nannizzia gypsea CBS 118893]|uniref:Uncharacterized protein n=1 Tax=Arthroderma gypseum (strain ATCC MYA-4604 / CBS 118893) TaxID=535722 RepID=E4UU38_ARTGP|nr:hypothetical protein MGYG_04631 [Nannizzia gypsea CBS 118893]EFR01628.1 hypothetical protein MGYG_04631 [Nannizzia gypsea CBS 118893]